MRHLGLCLAVLLGVGGGAGVGRAAVLNVPADYATIQAAIGAAVDGDEVVIAPGNYWGQIDTLGKAITVRSTNPLNRTVVNSTVLKADPGPIVSIQSGEGRATRLLGLTITRANGNATNAGGGVYVNDSSPTLAHNNICWNGTTWTPTRHGGGGICIAGLAAAPLVQYNRIHNNNAPGGAGIDVQGGNPTIRHNDVYENSAIYGSQFNPAGEGGGIRLSGQNCRALVESNEIHGNHGYLGGGGILSATPATIRGNRIHHNSANPRSGIGGVWSNGWETITHNVIYANNQGNVWLSGQSCQFINNTVAWSDDGVNLYVGYTNPGAQYEVRNCIIAHGRAQASAAGIVYIAGTVNIRYCDVFDNQWGNYTNNDPDVPYPDPTGTNGNISRPPLFANAALGDFHELSRAGRWDPLSGAWVNDTASSACIDAGDPQEAFGREPQRNGWTINMGAYGNTPEASKSNLVLTHWPADGSTGARCGAKIVVNFAWPVLQGTAESHFSLAPVAPVAANGASAGAVAGSFTWLHSRRTLEFTPSAPLEPQTSYRVTLAPGIMRMDGHRWPAGESVSFTTEAASRLVVTATAVGTAAGGAQVFVNLTAPATVRLSVCNLAGRLVTTLPEQALPASGRSLIWSGQSTGGMRVPGGTYLLRVVARAVDGSQSQALTAVQLRR